MPIPAPSGSLLRLEPGEAPNVAPWKGAGIGDVSQIRTRSTGDSA